MGGKGNQKGKGAHKGRRDQEKLERLRGSFRARSDADRRRLVKILRHEAALLGLPIREDGWVSLKDLNECVGTISGEDAARIIGRDEKDRLILSQEGEEVWVAAVSGHTIAGVVGPGRELPLQEVPEVLVRFLLTTNDIYLAPDGIPPEYISQIESWRKGPVPFPPRAAGSSLWRFAPGTAAGSRREGAAKTAAEKAQQRAEAVAEHKEAARFTERQEARRKLASAAPRGTVGVELQRALDSDCESCSDRREQSTLSAAAYATQRLRAMEARPPPEPVVLRPRHQPGTPARGSEQGALGSTDNTVETSERLEPELGDEEMELIEGSPKGDEPMSSVERSAPGIAEATLEGDEPMPSVERSAPGIEEVEPAVGPGPSAPEATAPEAALKEEQAAPGESPPRRAIWGRLKKEVLCSLLGEVALAEPEAIALKVDPDTLTAEIGKMSLEDEDPDWSGDEAEIPVATALPGEAASSSTKQEEGRGTKKELELDETEEPPRRRKVVLATGQLSLLRALAAANASNWSGVQRALKEAQGSGEEKSELVENLTSLAQAAAALAELEGAEAAYLAALPPALAELERKNPVRPSMDKSLGWINHARFLQDKEAAGVWVARRKEKSRLRAAAHRAAQQTAEGVGAGVQDPVRDQADAASHLNFQMNEAARDNLRRFQAELRAGELDAPMRAAVAQKRKPESERRRRIKWARFCEKQGKTRKYDPTESEQNHPYAHSGSPHLGKAMPWPASGPAGALRLENRGIPSTMGDGTVACFRPGHGRRRNRTGAWDDARLDARQRASEPERKSRWPHIHPASRSKAPPPTRPWLARPLPRDETSRRVVTRALWLTTVALLPIVVNAAEGDIVEEGDVWELWSYRLLTTGCLYLTWRTTLGWGVEKKEVACQTTQGHPPAADHVRVTPAGECFHAEHCGHLRARKSRAYRPCLDCSPLEPRVTRLPTPGSTPAARRQGSNYAGFLRVILGSLAALALLVLQGCDRPAEETGRLGNLAGPPLLGVSALVALLITWPGPPWRAPRPASRRVGEGTRKVRFAVRETRRETRGELLPAQTSSLTTRHHRRRGSHPLVAPSGNSPAETKRKFSEEGPEPGVVPARRWAQERLQLVKDHLSPSTQRLYDGHWRWWELYTRRRGVSALRSVDRFDPGEESLFLDYLVYLFVGQGLAAATAQARLGAIRSVHLQLGFPDPLKPLPRLQLALEGIRRRKGPIAKRRPVTPHMLARAQAALPQGLWGRQLNCALQLGFFFLLRVSELVGGNNPKLGLRVKDVKLYSRGEFLARPPFSGADEVQIVVRASKTDPEGESATRNLFRSDAAVCPVLATIEFLELKWSEATPHPEERFFGDLTRQDIQTALQTVAASLGEEVQAYTPHSLRFGGASAMWAGGMDSYVLRTWGRWNSDAFLAYLWTSRKASANTAACMARADMTPVKGFPNK
ncbi:ESS1 [Symbiodinium sp. CCMP2592]|nr:ESS1 [Symbiodinium sp. CCMP2592]